MLQIDKLKVVHNKDLRVLIEGLSFTVNDSDRIVLIGEEGNGKSTLLRLIHDPEKTSEYISYTGTISRGNMIFGYLPQECSAEDMDTDISGFMYSGGDTPAEISSSLSRFGLSPELLKENRKLKTLSGGERVKLQLARLSLTPADCYLLDEPSNDIDIPTLNILEDFINSSPVPVIFISHDEVLIENTANAVIHLELIRKKTVPRASFVRVTYQAYRTARDAALTKQGQIVAKQREEFDKRQARLREIMQKVENAQRSISRADPHGGRLLKKKMKSAKSQQKRFDKEEEKLILPPDIEDAVSMDFSCCSAVPAGKTVLDLKLPELTAGGKTLARNISLYIGGSDRICIIGANGTGKTTLLRIIAEQLIPRGDLNVGYMPQNYADVMDGDMTPVEFAAVSPDKASLTAARTYLGCLKFTAEEMTRPARELSGGQKAKLYFAKLILQKVSVLILDEPTRNLSPLSNPVLRRALSDFPGVIIAVSHDRKFICEVCDKVLLLDTEGLRMSDLSKNDC